MTMLFSSASSNLVVMTVDSAVALDFQDGHREYEEGRKLYQYQQLGCVSTWGARDGNRIGDHLNSIVAQLHSVESLAKEVREYLESGYCPDDYNLQDIGYHVGGFDQSGRPRLFHIFWETNKEPGSLGGGKYYSNDHSPPFVGTQLLYNGRNDLASIVAHKLIDEIRCGKPVRFDFNRPVDQVIFGDFVARFAGLGRNLGQM